MTRTVFSVMQPTVNLNEKLKNSKLRLFKKIMDRHFCDSPFFIHNRVNKTYYFRITLSNSEPTALWTVIAQAYLAYKALISESFSLACL